MRIWSITASQVFLDGIARIGLDANRAPDLRIVNAQLDYLPEPDIFHDVFGLVPLHADPVFADYLRWRW